MQIVCTYMHLTIYTLKISQDLTTAFQTHFSTFSHTHTHTHTGGHARTHTHRWARTHTLIHLCLCVWIHIYVCVRVLVFAHENIQIKPHHHRGVFVCVIFCLFKLSLVIIIIIFSLDRNKNFYTTIFVFTTHECSNTCRPSYAKIIYSNSRRDKPSHIKM